MRKKIVVVAVMCVLIGLMIPITAMSQQARTVTGEVVDTYCFALMGAKGESHRQCGIDCAKAGIPMGLLEDGTNQLYVLLPNKDKTAVSPQAMDKMGRKATISGKVYQSGGSQFLTVDSVK